MKMFVLNRTTQWFRGKITFLNWFDFGCRCKRVYKNRCVRGGSCMHQHARLVLLSVSWGITAWSRPDHSLCHNCHLQDQQRLSRQRHLWPATPMSLPRAQYRQRLQTLVSSSTIFQKQYSLSLKNYLSNIYIFSLYCLNYLLFIKKSKPNTNRFYLHRVWRRK